MQNASTIQCIRCGTPAAPDRKFCRKCGAPLDPQSPAAKPPARSPGKPASRPVAPATKAQKPAASAKPAAKPAAKPGAKKQGLSIWWIVVPTLLFAYLSRQIVPIVIAAAVGAALWWLKNYKVAPRADKNVRALEPFFPFAPAFHIAVVFIMLGGSIIVVGMLIAAVVAAARFRKQIVAALEPWWQIQSSIPTGIRKPIAVVAAGLVGYYFGKRAGGQEWTYTLISISMGAAVAFLIIFTPPDSVRPAKRT